MKNVIMTTAVRGKADRTVCHHHLHNAMGALESEFADFLCIGKWANIQLSADGKVLKDICISCEGEDEDMNNPVTEPDHELAMADVLHALKRHYPTPTPDAIQALREVADLVERSSAIHSVFAALAKALDETAKSK